MAASKDQEGGLPLLLGTTLPVAEELTEPLERKLPLPLTVLLLLSGFPCGRGDRSWNGEPGDSLSAWRGMARGAGGDKTDSKSESSSTADSGVRSDAGKGALDALVNKAG